MPRAPSSPERICRMEFQIGGVHRQRMVVRIGGDLPFRALKLKLWKVAFPNPKREPRGFCARNAERKRKQ